MTSLIELRVLDGPNLYFPRAAVKLTLDLSAILDAPPEAAAAFARRIGLQNARPNEAGSAFRQRFAARAIARLVRQIAAEAGTQRLAVRVRPTADVHRVIVAYPWRHRSRASALGRAVADVLDGLTTEDVDALVTTVAADVRAAELGPPPETIRPRIPVVAVTGTNGKTTTSRMIAHIARCAGLRTGWSSTDGVYIDGVLVEAGDYSGPSGAGRVLAHDDVQLAVTETARGGILLRGIGVRDNDVSVVTNISADHLGLQGIDTLDQLAEVKSVVARITKPSGWAVLNGDDPRVFAMRSVVSARVWVFSRDAGSPSIREALNDGGRATTLLDGWICVLEPNRDPDPLVRVVDVPMTVAGLSRFNVENALAATSAALGVGLSREAVVSGLESFAPSPDLNPGRMNIYSLGEITVVVDLAHNEAGLEALIEVMRGLRRPGARTLLGLGTAGDRTDDIVSALGEMAARDSDVVVIVHKQGYLRGREVEALDALYREGAARVGVEELPSYGSELAGLQELVARARPGDVVAVMCHADRPLLDEWLTSQGATVDSPAAIRDKATAATTSSRVRQPAEATVEGFNALAEVVARQALRSCLDVSRWVDDMLVGRPYESASAALDRAAMSAAALTPREIEAALARHPRIGERAGSGHDKALSEKEQSGVDHGDAAVARALAEGNAAYERRFDRVFLIRAAGRSSDEILLELRRRLDNSDDDELAEVVLQLSEIAILRLRQVIGA